MNIEIIPDTWSRTLYGLSGKIVNQNYGQIGKQLMDEMWYEIGSKGLKHQGINHWVYEDLGSLFVGVELDNPSHVNTSLIRKGVAV